MEKRMKDVFVTAFNKEENRNQILSIITMNNPERRELKIGKLPKYALAMGATAGAITIACVIGKMVANNKSLNVEMN